MKPNDVVAFRYGAVVAELGDVYEAVTVHRNKFKGSGVQRFKGSRDRVVEVLPCYVLTDRPTGALQVSQEVVEAALENVLHRVVEQRFVQLSSQTFGLGCICARRRPADGL
jgi:hypothetical protein